MGFLPVISLGILRVALIAIVLLSSASAMSQQATRQKAANSRNNIGVQGQEFPTVVTASPATIVYLRHTGPYWAIGPVVNEVAEMMQEVGSNGPLFIRYESDPRNTPPDRLELDVGFFVENPPHVEPPFEIEFLDSRRVISLKTNAAPRANLAQIQSLQDWIEQHSLEESGPTLEIWSMNMNPEGAALSQSELQIPVTACSTPVLGFDTPVVANSTNLIAGHSGDKTASTKTRRETESQKIRVEETQGQPRERKESGPQAPVLSVTNDSPSDTDRKIHSLRGRPANEPRPLAPFPGNVTDPEEMRKIIEDAWADRWKHDSNSPRNAAKVPASAPAFGSPPIPQTVNSIASSTKKLQHVPVAEKSGADASTLISPSNHWGDASTISVAHLLDTENYLSLSERIVPDAKRIHPSLQVWLGQVVFRISAVANGMRKNYPGEADELTAFAGILKDRYRDISKEFTLDAGERDPSFELGSQYADRKTQIMRNMDRLMGKISMKTTDPDAARIELTAILNATLSVLGDAESAVKNHKK